MPHVFETIDGNRRVRWYPDEHYQTIGSYAYDTEAETKAAEDDELAKLASGEWFVLCAIAATQTDCTCPECDGWHKTDALCGIVIEPNEDKLREFAEGNGWIGAAACQTVQP